MFRYLLALSRSCRPRPTASSIPQSSFGLEEYDGLEPVNGQIAPPKSAFKRLHLVYILHDVLVSLHQWHMNDDAPPPYQSLDLRFILGMLKEELTRLFRLAACHGDFSADEVSQQLSMLVTHWVKQQIFTDEELETLRTLAKSARDRDWDQVIEECNIEDERRVVEQREAFEEATKWQIPVRHGVKDDPDAPWYELPAANGLYMKQTRGYPLRASAFPKGGYQVKNGGQEADPDLQKDVMWLHKELVHCFDDYTNADDLQDIDPLGNKIWKDPERPTRNYWGFTYDGIEKVRENSMRFQDSATGYHDVPPLMHDSNSMDNVDSAVARARALAGGRGGFDRGGFDRGGFDRGGGGRGRGGRGSWRGPPRGGNGYRGDFRGGRGGPQGRF